MAPNFFNFTGFVVTVLFGDKGHVSQTEDVVQAGKCEMKAEMSRFQKGQSDFGAKRAKSQNIKYCYRGNFT